MKNLAKLNLIFLFFISVSLFAQEKSEKLILTADDAVSFALKEHVDIQRSEISLKKAKREYKNSWNKVLPSVTASANASEKKSWADSSTDEVNVTAKFAADLSLDTGLASSIKALKSSYEEGKISYEDTVRKTENSVRSEFYHLLYLKEKVENSQTTLDSYEKQYEQAKNKYSRGTVTELDLLTAQVNVETAKPNVDSAKTAFTNALYEFLDAIGIERGTQVELLGSLDDADKIAKIERSVLDDCEEKSSEIKMMQKKLENAKQTKKSTFSSLFLPTLKLGAEVSPEIYTYDKKAENSTNTPNWNISVAISLPIESWIPGSSSSVKVAALGDTVKDYEIQLVDLQKTVRTNATEEFEAIELSQKNIAARKMNVELAQKTYQMTEEAYNRGTKDMLSLQDALSKLSSAKLQLKEEQYSLLSNVLSLEITLSLPSKTFLKSENK